MEIRQVYIHSEPSTVLEIAKIYQLAFGGPPWQEGYICPLCQFTVDLQEELIVCPRCHERESLINMVECWPTSKVINDFYQENTKPDSLCLIAYEYGNVVGFVWGYKLTISAETSIKLDAPKLADIYLRDVFYLDECAVLPQFQKQGIGRKLVESILRLQPYNIMLLRTLEGSPMQHLVESLDGEKVLSISKGRIIMRLIKFGHRHLFIAPPHY